MSQRRIVVFTRTPAAGLFNEPGFGAMQIVVLRPGAGESTTTFHRPRDIAAVAAEVLLHDAMLAIATYQKAGGPTAKTSDSVERILGRPPRTIVDFVRDYVDRFRD